MTRLRQRAGHSQTSVFSTLMERIRNDEDEAVAKSAAGSMYMGTSLSHSSCRYSGSRDSFYNIQPGQIR